MTYPVPFRILASFLAFGVVLTARASEPLRAEPSAFLQASAGTSVNWQPWGEAALARAREEQKPVYLAIGSFSSELSRAMQRQTFSNPETAAFLNESFICILVDAKEQPELTALYQNYVETVKQLRGLPLNLWLTPELKPFEGANYLPPTEEWGKEGFLTVARRAAAGWVADAAAQRTKADEAVATIAAAQLLSAPAAVDNGAVTEALAAGIEAWRARLDTTHGGFGEAPKYPEPELLRALLRQADTREMAVTTLRQLAQGAVRDPLDGGFFRYATDLEWKVPYFQKHLADQARLALAFLDAAGITGETAFAEVARASLDYALTTLAGDVAGEDATREELTAAYFWTLDEMNRALGPNAAAVAASLGATAAGNIPADTFPGTDTAGKNILFLADASAAPKLAPALAKLRTERAGRATPLRDDGATSGTHGLLLAALARAGADLKEPRFTQAAREQFAFLRQHLVAADGSLKRVADRPTAASPADYASTIQGLATFARLHEEPAARTLANALLARLNQTYFDSATGRYFAIHETTSPSLWARVRPPLPAAGDPPSAEPALLLALADLNPADATLSAQLLAAVVEDVRAAPEVPRGDALLALASTAGAR